MQQENIIIFSYKIGELSCAWLTLLPLSGYDIYLCILLNEEVMMMLPSARSGLHDAFYTISFMHWMISWAFNNRYIGSIQYVQLIWYVLFKATNKIYSKQYLFCYVVSPGILIISKPLNINDDFYLLINSKIYLLIPKRMLGCRYFQDILFNIQFI